MGPRQLSGPVTTHSFGTTSVATQYMLEDEHAVFLFSDWA